MRVKLKQFEGTFCPKITVFYYISHANKITREFSAEKFHWSNSDPKMSDRPYQVIDRSYHTR